MNVNSNKFEYSEWVIVYAVIVHQTNISYSNEVPVCKTSIIIWYGEQRQLYLLLFLTPWL